MRLPIKDEKSKNLTMKFEELGFSPWFRTRWGESHPVEFSLDRVVAVHKDNYMVRDEEAEIPTEVNRKIVIQKGIRI